VRRRAIAAVSKDNPQDYGSITKLRELLGLTPSQDTHDTVALHEDALIVSIDMELEHERLRDASRFSIHGT
jgi:hypothetical protein